MIAGQSDKKNRHRQMENESRVDSETDVCGIKQKSIKAENRGKMMVKARNQVKDLREGSALPHTLLN